MARVPVLLSLVAGVLLVWRALRSVASAEAAIFGAVLVLACPIVMRYYVTAVADVPLAVVLFAAFLVWWNADAKGPVSVARWAGIGCLLAIAALLKGPQPVAFFMLGILIYAMLTSNWRLLPGLVLAGLISAIPTASWYALVFVPGDQHEWLRYTRLSSPGIAAPHPFSNAVDFFLESFPASLLAVALLLAKRTAPRESHRPNFVLALSCYTLACTFVILFWPAEVNPRYILPMVLPLCVLGGIAFDALSATRPALVAASIAIVTCLIGYALVQSAVDVLWKPNYIRTKIAGQKIEAMIEKDPGPIYRTAWDAGMNELAYVPRKIMTIDRSAVQSVPKPAWIVLPTGEVDALVASSAGHLTPELALERATLLRSQ
jgi:4-amino-4-deoxy-L-arabinose transferase-like glycosyltransferase